MKHENPIRTRPRKRAMGAALVVTLIATGALTAQSAVAAEPDGIVSVTPITEVGAYGQRVTAVALEFSSTVDSASVSLDDFKVQDSSYNFRFNPIEDLSKLVDRDISAVYTNSEANLRPDDTSMAGKYVVVELADESPGGWTVRTSTNTRYVRINPDLPTRVFQLGDVKGVGGETLSTAKPAFAWRLNKPAVNLEVDQFKHVVAQTSTGAVPYDYRLPDNYDSTKNYPVVVVLPGQGMGYDGVNERVQIVADIPATAWFQREWTGTDEDVIVLAIQSPRVGVDTEAAQAIEVVESFVSAHAVDKDRVYLSSVSWGSRLIWQMTSTRGDLFAGALLTGGFPASATQLAAIAEAEVPFWITHGTNDALLRVANARTSYQGLVAAYQARGLDESAIARLTHWTEYGNEWFSLPDYHLAAAPTYEDESILQWLLAQNKSIDLKDGDDVKVSAVVETGGGLALNLGQAQADLGTLELDSSLSFLAASGELPTFTVADTRSSDAGWSLTVTSSAFRTESGYAIDAKHLGLDPKVLSATDGQTVSEGAAIEAGTGFGSGATLVSAKPGEGRGTATAGGALTLKAPTNTHEGAYVSRIAVNLL
ncbi:WxL domain-containing protein [Microbacterium saperdae]